MLCDSNGDGGPVRVPKTTAHGLNNLVRRNLRQRSSRGRYESVVDPGMSRFWAHDQENPDICYRRIPSLSSPRKEAEEALHLHARHILC
jgi:hypothetical protein